MSQLSILMRDVMALDPAVNAIEFEGRWWSWGDISQAGQALKAALSGAGIGAGARVAVMARNHPANACAIIELIVADQCMVTLNPTLPDERLSNDIRGLQPVAVVGLASDWARASVRVAAAEIGCMGIILGDLGEPPVTIVEGLERATGVGLRREAPGIAIEMLSSGTTGTPKRIPLKAASFAEGIISAGVFDGRKPGDPARLRSGVQILNSPFAHIGGVFGLFNCLAAGRSGCLLEKFSVGTFVDAVRRHRPKVVGAPPSALRMILDAKVPKEDLSSLVAFRVSTAPLPQELGDAFYETYDIPVLQNYGATEFAGGVAGWTLQDFKLHHLDKRGSVGRLNPGVECRITHPETGDVLPLGEVGLLELRASQLGDGKSWVKTTDLAVRDKDDFIWIKGRYDNAIIRGGFKVMPDDVVKAIELHPAVLEAAVVGLPDPRLGEVPVAAYLIRSGVESCSEAELRDFLKEKLLPYQVPVKLLQVAEMPRTPSMKVSQPDLKAMFLQHQD